MIKTYAMLIDELQEYKNPKTKIQRMVRNKELYSITKGLYETNPFVNPFYLANPILFPSYISFETALSYYGLIPEKVFTIKSATYNMTKKKQFDTSFGLYTYQDIPKEVYGYGVSMFFDDGYVYQMATKEKALLDLIYTMPKISNMKEMRELLFEDLRINEMGIDMLDIGMISELYPLYHSCNVALFERMLRGGKLHAK